jgi:PAS domain S-box-containing protein
MNQSTKVEASCAGAQMERFFHAAVEMFFVADRRGHLLQVNPAWQRTLGHTDAALLGKGWRHYLHKDDVAATAAALRALGRGEAVETFTVRFKAAAGDWRWLEWTPASSSGAADIFATLRDVTRVLADRTLLSELQECSGIGHWGIDPANDTVTWAKATHAVFGTDAESHVPCRSDMIAPFTAEAQARLGPALERLLTEGAAFHLELPLIRPDGQRRRVRLSAGAEMRGSVPARVYGTIEDVTREHDAWHETYRLGNIALRTTNLLVVATDAERRITWVNPAFEQFSGYSLAEVKGRNPGHFLQCDATDPQTVTQLRAALGAGRSVRVEIQNQAKSGNQYWLDIDIQPIRDSRGVLTGFISIQSDITDRKALEGALRAERNKLRATLEAMPDLVMEVNADGYFTGFHSSGVTEVPLPPDLFLGRKPEDAFTAEVAAVFRKAMAQTQRAGRADGHEIRTETADGVRWFELSSSRRPVESPGARPGYVIVLHDITRRVHQQAAIVRTTELFKGLFDNSPIAIALSDFETGEFLDVNRAYETVTGFSREEMLATDAMTLGTRQGWAEERRIGNQQLLRDGRYGPTEMECRRRDGTPYTAQVRALLLDDAEGKRRVWTFIDDISARRRQEEERERLTREASEARRRLEDALSVLPDGFVYYDADDRLVMCNDRYREFYPLSAEAMVPGARFEDILRVSLKRGQHLPAIGREEEWLAERLAARETPISDQEQKLFDGRWLRVIERRTPEGGRVGMRIDVTALKQAEARLANIIEGSRVGIWEWSSVTDASESNEQWAQMLGYDLDDVSPMSSKDWRKIVHPDDLLHIDAVMQPVRGRQIKRVEYEYRMRDREGHWVWVLTRARATWHADGSLTVAGVNLDITERKMLEAALQSERDYLARLMETSISGIIAVDDAGRIKFANREAEALLGLVRDAGPCPDYADPDWHIEALDGTPVNTADLPYKRVLANGAIMRDFRHAIVWPDGRRRALSVNAAPIDQPGLGARVVCSITDITERLETEAALREAAERAEVASRTKSQFLANMSHEIRTPLNGVLGMAEILHDMIGDPEQREMVETIRESGETLLGVLNDILDLSKIEAGKLTMESTLFRPTDLVAKIETMHSLMSREKGLDLSVYTNTAAGHRRLGDPHRLMQVLHNLVGNAVKFTDSGSVRLILRAEEGGALQIEVTDTGIGMSAEQVQRVFEDFEQADGSMTRRYGGTGLGMSIVRRLVGMMDGTIRVESAPGRGTSVFVGLPIPEAEDAAASRTAAAEGDVTLDGLRVLAAEDSAANRRILDTFLTSAGAEVTLVEHGAAALDAWPEGRFDLVLLDISMPVMDGLTALAELRARAEEVGEALPPAIAITANAMTHQVEDYRDAGFADHVAKPFSRRELLEVIVRVLQRV